MILRPLGRILGLIAFTSIGLFAQDKSPAFYLKDGDKVVFYGDSITEQRLYTTFVETYVVTRFPKMQVSFIHSGWGGDTVGGGGGGPIDLRLDRDVIAYKPTVLTIMLGMNDGGYRAYDDNIFNNYTKGYEHLLDTVQKALPDLRITLIQPSPYDDVTREPKFEGGYNAVLLRFADYLKKTADERHYTLADFNTPVTAMLEKAKTANATLSQNIIPDRVHPSPAGHLIMAEGLLKAWQAPSIVTNVELNAKNAQPVHADFTKVTDLKLGDTLTWKQLDERLPFPVQSGDPLVALALASSDFSDALNQQMLKVTGLTGNGYLLTIDGSEIGTYSKAQLEAGINLGPLATPMQKQATKVAQLTVQHNDKHFQKWRSIQVPLAGDTNAAVTAAIAPLLQALDAEEQELVTQQRAAAQPESHEYSLSPATATDNANLALNKTYVCSDPNTFSWGDGLTDGSWVGAQGNTFASGSADSFPKSVTIDLTQSVPLAKVVAGVPAFGSTKTITVALSDNNTDFKDVGTYVFSTHTEEKHNYTFPTQSARYIRLTYPDHSDENVGYDPNFVFTSEVEAYGPAK